ncbi:MAG: glycosyltransferase family 39 protein [Vicinamibacteria bacterium]
MRFLGVLAMCCAVGSLVSAGYAAWDQGWTTDERLHLAWSRRFWDSGETERDSADRYDSKTPIHVPNAVLSRFFEQPGDEDEPMVRFTARVPQLVWLALLYVAVGGLAGRLGGPLAARIGVLFASLEPNLVAHASVVTTDIPFAAATALALWAAISCRQQPQTLKAVALGGFIGLALTAKFSAVLLTPLAMGAAFWRTGDERKRVGLRLLVCVSCAWLALAGAYGFGGLFKPLGSSNWKSNLFQALASRAGRFPVPLPMAFVEGVDRSRSRDALVDWIVVILGRPSHHPVWYFFLVGWALKTPISLMLVSLACIPWLLKQAVKRPDISWLLVHQVANLLFFSFAFRTQLGYRFVLMLVPITCALMAAAVSTSMPPKWLMPGLLLVTATSLAETVPFWGDPLAFSNAVVRPKKAAYRFLANSDIDWNQNRDRWVKFQKAAELPDNGALNPADLRLGLNVVTTSRVAGVIPGDTFRWARENLEPTAVAGWTHHYFDVTEEQYDRFLQEARQLQPTPDAQQICGLSADAPMDAPGLVTRFQPATAPYGIRISVLCVATRKGADVAARVERGRFDLIPSGRPDLKTYLPPGESVLFRLEPGVHAFAIVESPYRRTSLAYELNAAFSVERHGGLVRIFQIEPKDLPPGSGLARWFGAQSTANLP